MKVSTSLISAAALLASSAAAAPSLQRRSNTYAHPYARSRPFTVYNTKPLPKMSGIHFGPAASSETDPNWAGAVQQSQNITEVSGSITFPSVSLPSGASNSTEYLGSAWVGIDGSTCTNAILQAGIYWILQGGQSQLFAFYEWYPAPVQMVQMSAKAGDVFSISVVAASATSGTFNVENTSTGETFNTTLSNQQPLCMQNAEWILEDNEEMPFATFDQVAFSDASWVANGVTGDLSGAATLNIVQNGATLTNCAISSSSDIQCTPA